MKNIMIFTNTAKYNSVLKLFRNQFIKSRLHFKNYSQSPVYNDENKVKSIFKFWKSCFVKNKVLEPKESIEHILAFNLGSTSVSVFCYYNFIYIFR